MSAVLAHIKTFADSELRKLPTLALFRLGYSTMEIAAMKGQPESRIYNWLSKAREAERRQIEQLRTGS